MTLYVNGDSHSHGTIIDPKHAYPQLVADHFGLKLKNLAKVGSSNQRILRTTQEALSDPGFSPELLIIGWSTWEREEWLHNGQYYDINSSGHTGLPDSLIENYKSWVVDQTPEVMQSKSQQWHEKIYQLHTQLQQRQIPHVFFNCMYNFFSPKEEYNWKESFVYPYNNDYSFYWYLKNQGCQPNEWYHYLEDGHQCWADFLINYINTNKIL